MHFLGLPFAELVTIFAIAGGAVTALYVLKLRRRPITVPFSKLWARILKDKEATSLFSRLKRIFSLLLQLAMLALLVLALGDPRAAIEIVKGRNLVVLVDTSASMQARDGGPAGKKPRIDEARESLRKIVRGLGASDHMLIASMDAVVTPLTPMTGDTSRLEQALDELRPVDARADFPRALRYAVDTLRGVKRAEIVVLSDGVLGEAKDGLGAIYSNACDEENAPKPAGKFTCVGDARLSFVPVGSGKRNVAITQYSVRRYPLDRSRYEVMIEVQNLGDKDEDIELRLLGDGVLVDLTKLHLKAGEKLPRFYPNLGGASQKLEARINIAPLSPSDPPIYDDLPADDRAYAVLPERRRTKVLAVTDANTYLEAALLLDEYLDVTTMTPDEWRAHGELGKSDVAIYDGVTPPLKPGLPALYLDPKDGGPIKVGPAIKEPGFDTLDRKHPLLRWTAFDNIGITTANKLVPAEGDKIVGASNDGPLLVAGSRAGTKFVALSFDVRQSDLPLRIAWPVFLMNTINWFVEEDADYLSSFKTGEVWHVPVPLGVTSQAVLVDPEGAPHPVPVQEGRAVYLGERAGFYRIKAPPDVTTPSGATPSDVYFAANLVEPRESAIAPEPALAIADEAWMRDPARVAHCKLACASGVDPECMPKCAGHEAGQVKDSGAGVRDEKWMYLLALVAIATVVEWATYHRRITV